MRFEISEAEQKKAKHPHEIFLLNLITNHILVFVALLGMATTYPQLLLIIPIISAGALGYILYQASQSTRRGDSWFVMCNWKIAAQRSKFFLIMIGLMVVVLVGAMVAIEVLEAPFVMVAAIGGVGVLPVMLAVLALIMMESDALYQVRHGSMSKSMVERFPPPPEYRVIDEPEQS